MKKIRYFIISIMLVLVLSACENGNSSSNNKKTTENNENGVVDIYYPNDNNVAAAKEKYQIKQPDSVPAALEEIMLCMKNYLDEGMTYNTYLLDVDSNLTLEFVCNGEYNREYILLAKAAVCQTVFQIKDINSISIVIYDSANQILEENFYLRNSFYFYEYEDEELINQ